MSAGIKYMVWILALVMVLTACNMQMSELSEPSALSESASKRTGKKFLQEPVSEEQNPLSAWLGTYEFSESYDYSSDRHSVLAREYLITIYEENEDFFAKIEIDGRTALARGLARVEGDEEQISLIFEEYLPEHMFGGFNAKKGDVLLSFVRLGDVMYTEWANMEAVLYSNMESGKEYFTRKDAGKEHLQYGEWWTIGTIEMDKRIDFLRYHGFFENQPFYVYRDSSNGQVQLELYYDSERAAGCGIRYIAQIQEPELLPCVFAFYQVQHKSWQPPDVFSVLADGRDGKNEKGYQEEWFYDESGRITGFRSEALLDWVDPVETGPFELINVQFTYREDGTLESREFWCNPMCFGTAGCYERSLYDEEERIVFSSTYITHGSIEQYYIYENGSSTPSYCLSLDENPGWQFYPELNCYEEEQDCR